MVEILHTIGTPRKSLRKFSQPDRGRYPALPTSPSLDSILFAGHPGVVTSWFNTTAKSRRVHGRPTPIIFVYFCRRLRLRAPPPEMPHTAREH